PNRIWGSWGTRWQLDLEAAGPEADRSQRARSISLAVPVIGDSVRRPNLLGTRIGWNYAGGEWSRLGGCYPGIRAAGREGSPEHRHDPRSSTHDLGDLCVGRTRRWRARGCDDAKWPVAWTMGGSRKRADPFLPPFGRRGCVSGVGRYEFREFAWPGP